jgi:hypothetical protein
MHAGWAVFFGGPKGNPNADSISAFENKVHGSSARRVTGGALACTSIADDAFEPARRTTAPSTSLVVVNRIVKILIVR